MKVREVLDTILPGTMVKVYQTPIARFDNGVAPVLRQYANILTIKTSNQNYLDFDVINIFQDNGIFAITCKANPEQEQAIIRSWYGLI